MSRMLADHVTANAVALMLLALSDDHEAFATLLADKTATEHLHLTAFLARYAALRAIEADRHLGVDTRVLFQRIALNGGHMYE